ITAAGQATCLPPRNGFALAREPDYEVMHILVVLPGVLAVPVVEFFIQVIGKLERCFIKSLGSVGEPPRVNLGRRRFGVDNNYAPLRWPLIEATFFGASSR